MRITYYILKLTKLYLLSFWKIFFAPPIIPRYALNIYSFILFFNLLKHIIKYFNDTYDGDRRMLSYYIK